MDKANVSIRKYFSKQTISGISSHIAANKLVFRHHKLRLNISVKRIMIELLSYNGTFGILYILEPGLRCTSIVIIETNLSIVTYVPIKEEEIRETGRKLAEHRV